MTKATALTVSLICAVGLAMSAAQDVEQSQELAQGAASAAPDGAGLTVTLGDTAASLVVSNTIPVKPDGLVLYNPTQIALPGIVFTRQMALGEQAFYAWETDAGNRELTLRSGIEAANRGRELYRVDGGQSQTPQSCYYECMGGADCDGAWLLGGYVIAKLFAAIGGGAAEGALAGGGACWAANSIGCLDGCNPGGRTPDHTECRLVTEFCSPTCLPPMEHWTGGACTFNGEPAMCCALTTTFPLEVEPSIPNSKRAE